MDLLAEINNFTFEYFGVTLPSPNDDLTLKL